jgi:hypothetical protein
MDRAAGQVSLVADPKARGYVGSDATNPPDSWSMFRLGSGMRARFKVHLTKVNPASPQYNIESRILSPGFGYVRLASYDFRSLFTESAYVVPPVSGEHHEYPERLASCKCPSYIC